MLLMGQVTRVWTCENPFLSVMILTLPSRAKMLAELMGVLEAQRVDGVELLVNSDHKTKSVGVKRQECLDAATGKYLAFIDDDDLVTGDYLSWLSKAAADDSDVITFDQRAQIDDHNPFIVNFSLRHKANEQMKIVAGVYQNITRPPWHMNAWRSSIAKQHRFEDKSWAEDWDWCAKVIPHLKTETHINRVLHLYRFREKVSQCPAK